MASESRVGTKIKLRRQVLGLTQVQLAERIGVDPSSVIAWEKDKHFPTRHQLHLEAVLGISLDGEGTEVYDDPAEAALWALDRYSPDERRKMIEQYRQDRSTRDRTAG